MGVGFWGAAADNVLRPSTFDGGFSVGGCWNREFFFVEIGDPWTGDGDGLGLGVVPSGSFIMYY